uniref:uncharacterized protein isoform X4 n=1 Tax=Pristiophorus japonicus TaxID=55135 RepID=UPI00398F2059
MNQSDACEPSSYDDEYLDHYLDDVSYGDDDVFLPNSMNESDACGLANLSSASNTSRSPMTRYAGTWDLANLSSASKIYLNPRPMTRSMGPCDFPNISSSIDSRWHKPTRSSCPLPLKKQPFPFSPTKPHLGCSVCSRNTARNTTRQSHFGNLSEICSTEDNDVSSPEYDMTADSFDIPQRTCRLPNMNSSMIDDLENDYHHQDFGNLSSIFSADSQHEVEDLSSEQPRVVKNLTDKEMACYFVKNKPTLRERYPPKQPEVVKKYDMTADSFDIPQCTCQYDMTAGSFDIPQRTCQYDMTADSFDIPQPTCRFPIMNSSMIDDLENEYDHQDFGNLSSIFSADSQHEVEDLSSAMNAGARMMPELSVQQPRVAKNLTDEEMACYFVKNKPTLQERYLPKQPEVVKTALRMNAGERIMPEFVYREMSADSLEMSDDSLDEPRNLCPHGMIADSLEVSQSLQPRGMSADSLEFSQSFQPRGMSADSLEFSQSLQPRGMSADSLEFSQSFQPRGMSADSLEFSQSLQPCEMSADSLEFSQSFQPYSLNASGAQWQQPVCRNNNEKVGEIRQLASAMHAGARAMPEFAGFHEMSADSLEMSDDSLDEPQNSCQRRASTACNLPQAKSGGRRHRRGYSSRKQPRACGPCRARRRARKGNNARRQ